MDYVAANNSEEVDSSLLSSGSPEDSLDAEILSKIKPTDVSLDIIPQDRVRIAYMEPHHVIRSYKADIVAYAAGHSKADDYEDLKVGSLRFKIINMAFPREKGNLADHPRDICDSHSRDMYNLYAALYHNNGKLKRSVVNRLDPEAGDWYSAFAILYVEMLSIEEEFRGRKLGQAALETAIRHYGLGCEFAVLAVRAFETDSKKPEGVALDKRLTRMYKKQGFAPLPNSRYMVRNLEVWAPRLDWLTS